MKINKHSLLVMILVSIAALSSFAYFAGAFDRSLNLLTSGAIKKLTEIQEQPNKTHLRENENGIVIRCEVYSDKQNSLCGVTLLTAELVSQGIDITDFSSVVIALQSIRDSNQQIKGIETLKLTLKNYNDLYSNKNDVVSQKYNSVILAIDSEEEPYTIPLSYFQVETWWMHRYGVQFENAQTELTNVQSLEVMANDIDSVGTYEFVISGLELEGKWISQTQLLAFILILSILAIVILIDRQREQQRLLSFVDPLTGLSNRRGLQHWVKSLGCSEKSLKKAALIYMDVDDFKAVNDTFGHHVGDKLLIAFCEGVIASCEKLSLHKKYIHFTRLSGDEFAIMLLHVTDEDAQTLAKTVLEHFQTPLKFNNDEVFLSASMGISSDILTSDDTRELFRKADAAMYFAKRRGKNCVKIYDSQVEHEQVHRKNIAQIMQTQIDNNELNLRFLPIYSSSSKKVEAAEVVFGGFADELKEIDVVTLKEIAKEFKLLDKLDMWLTKSCFILLQKYSNDIESLNLRFHINITSFELNDHEYTAGFCQLLNDYSIGTRHICLEINETALLDGNEQVNAVLHKFNDMGIKLILDDFGVERTAISQMVQYPIHALKIHESFIQKIDSHSEKPNLVVQSIISMAKTCDLEVIAEGVNNLDQFYCLQDMGCDKVQGLVFCDPLTINELIKGLSSQKMFGSKPQDVLA